MGVGITKGSNQTWIKTSWGGLSAVSLKYAKCWPSLNKK